LSSGPCYRGVPPTSLCVTGIPGAAYSVRRRSSRTSSASALIAGALAGFPPSPALCDDGLLLPFLAVTANGVVNLVNILAMPGTLVKAFRRSKLYKRVKPCYDVATYDPQKSRSPWGRSLVFTWVH